MNAVLWVLATCITACLALNYTGKVLDVLHGDATCIWRIEMTANAIISVHLWLATVEM